jgi:hypothetical protein
MSKLIFTIIATAVVLSTPAQAQDKWLLKSNTVNFHGATLGNFKKLYDTKSDCEAEKKMITDYIREMQPQLLPDLGMECVLMLD